MRIFFRIIVVFILHLNCLIGIISQQSLPFNHSCRLIYDNDDHRDTYTDEFLLGLAHLDIVNCRAFITTYKEYEYDLFTKGRKDIVDKAKKSGFRNLPLVLEGTDKILKMPVSRKIEDTRSLQTKAGRFIVKEAHGSSVDTPLVIITGGQLTVVADAYLQDTTIAEKIVVIGIFGVPSIDYNAHLDAWAWTIVLHKFRSVGIKFREKDGTFGKAYMKMPEVPKDKIRDELPQDNEFFKWMYEKRHPKQPVPEKDADGQPIVAFVDPGYLTKLKRWSPVAIDEKGHPVLIPDSQGTVYEVLDADQDIATQLFWKTMLDVKDSIH